MALQMERFIHTGLSEGGTSKLAESMLRNAVRFPGKRSATTYMRSSCILKSINAKLIHLLAEAGLELTQCS